MAKKAFTFVFTDWHVGSPSGVEDWAPFATNVPPDGKTIRDITDEVNRSVDEILPQDFPRIEIIRLAYLRTGADVFDRPKAEPDWKKVWGVIVDRGTISKDPGKLETMAKGLADAMGKSGVAGRTSAPVFLTSKGIMPSQLSFYGEKFKLFSADNRNLLIYLIAGELVAHSQHDPPEVAGYIEEKY